ncbi:MULTISPECIES: CysB family HTH-type transcriptional regulator [unclassified Rubrivivax]|uniref:CysB family HTH-type transcriptional regulator n=1 Tax=unclassified Rubrivivax TaxID=2649762 RepID=UPI001E4C09F8|nr:MULTISPECIES: CysB family HTH-type transcriptional regulator [unclassified Rubrivivax]MCC9596651.1 CysB family HTH-type transcriptional regulator [Rubrivivax sp. JA1055]MCC9648808.1 CysB family HTH-type transcriptional regulator [Rubrivivax sp. JA1029]MCD0423038.1 CysB family HTH-type transcriptional regulator [Rubrivivax sp. JA1024]
MNFQQLRSVRETVRRGFNLTEVAQVLHTSQPGVSRQIRELETELGVDIFVRAGKRLTGLTAPGATILPIVERLLQEADNLKRAGDDYAGQGKGTLVIAATHSQARYALPTAVRDFRATHPDVQLRLHQGSPQQVAELLLEGEADLGVATALIATCPDLVALPCYRWTHSVVVPAGHVLAQEAERGVPLTLERLAEFPLITYEPGYTGRSQIDEAFSQKGLVLDLVLSAMDADVIKTYVELGMGVGIIAAMAWDEQRDPGLRAIDARHLFATNMTHVGLRRGAYLRDYVYDFIRTFAAPLDRALVDRALAAPAGVVVEP